jgi:hypothetical protein
MFARRRLTDSSVISGLDVTHMKKGLRKHVRILVDVRVDVKLVIRHSLKTKNLGYT